MLITIIVAVLVAVFVSISVYRIGIYQEIADKETAIGSGLAALLFVFIIGTFISLPLHVKNMECETKLTCEENIYSLDGNSVVSGVFAIGTGQVSNDFVYIFYVDNGDGSYKMKYVNAKYCSIIESDTETPNIKFYERVPVNTNWWTGWGNAAVKLKHKDIYPMIITVPVGTVKHSYNGNFGG